MKALIADDSALARLFVRQWLHVVAPRLEIVEAADAPEALALATEHAPRLAFLDIQLPSGSGLEVAEAIRDRLPGTVVIICTTHDSAAHRRRAAAAGAALFVAKARIQSEEVKVVVEAAVGGP